MTKFAKNLLVGLAGSSLLQKPFEQMMILSQFMLGIGSGSPTETSGEKQLIKRLKNCLRTSEPVYIFDVGANDGQFLDLLETGLQGESIQIHAFEPGNHSHQRLVENVKKYSNVTVNQFGLGKQIGERQLFYDEAGSHLASLTRRRLEHVGKEFKFSETVKIDTLDHYCEDHAIQYIDLLKLDVEGHELDVLEGGRKMLTDRKIRMVSFEFGGCNIDTRTYFQDFWYFFKEYGGFNLFRITPSGNLIPINKYRNIDEQFRTTNYLAVRQ